MTCIKRCGPKVLLIRAYPRLETMVRLITNRFCFIVKLTMTDNSGGQTSFSSRGIKRNWHDLKMSKFCVVVEIFFDQLATASFNALGIHISNVPTI